MDLLNFRLLRTPRIGIEGPLPAAEMTGPLHDKISAALSQNPQDDSERIKTMAKEWRLNAPELAVVKAGTLDAEKNKDVALAFHILDQTDKWLRAREDRPGFKEFLEYRAAGRAKDNGWPKSAKWTLARGILCDWLLTLWTLKDNPRLAVFLTRRLLILDILDPRVLPDAKINSVDSVWSNLHRRSVLMDASATVTPEWKSVELVRGAKIDDLYVVRSEWSCYKAGEIASIINVLSGESFENSVKEINEEEITESEDRDVTESTEQFEEEKTQTELSKEMERAASLQVGIEGSVDVSGQYGLTKFGASASASTAISLSENNTHASRTAREMTSRAVAKVESRVREARSRRLLNRVQTKTTHTISNDSDSPVRGVYRWVDRVDRYQVFRYPNRLLLEFQIPEPGVYLRYRLSKGAGQPNGDIDIPPNFDLDATSITSRNYAEMARKFRASNIPPPPDQKLFVTHVIKARAEPAANEERKVVWAAPLIQDTIDVTLPSGYLAVRAKVSGSAYPMRQFWRVESRDFTNNKDQIEGFHRITAHAYAGKAKYAIHQDGTAGRRHTVQLPNTNPMLHADNSRTMYGDAVLTFEDKVLTFTGRVQGKVCVGFHISGASSAEVGFEVECVPSDQTMSEWQLAVYDSLLDAWRGWEQQYKTQQLARGGPSLSGVNGRSPLRNKELVQSELKRQVISWLLNDRDFAGVDGMAGGMAWERFSIEKARADAPMVQFLEQAFEWGNLTFMLYDYFWARGDQWDALADIEAADPEFARFLRSGSARVVLPARPGFEDAVHHWLLWGEPFLGEALPLPGDPLYVALATEIREIKDSPAGGIPGDSWETRMGTTLLWLDNEPELPHNEARRLGLAPHTPVDPICDEMGAI